MILTIQIEENNNIERYILEINSDVNTFTSWGIYLVLIGALVNCGLHVKSKES